MPLSNTYYESLKTQLETAAMSKKAAYDAALLRMTSATFDTEGRLTGYADNKPGSLDVAQMEKTRNIKTGSEQSGMLRSGQYARELATSQAEYRKAITDLGAENTANKGAVDTETANELAKYKAMYGDGTTKSGNSSGTGIGATPSSTPAAAPSSNPALIAAPPTFVAPTTAASAGNFRMMEEKLSAKPVPEPAPKPAVGKPIAPNESIPPPKPPPVAPKKPAPPPPPPPPPPKPKPVPVSNKIKTLK